MKDTYEVRLRCGNCGHGESAAIPKGTTISQYCGHASCFHCGCTNLYEDPSVPKFTYHDYDNNRYLCADDMPNDVSDKRL